VVRLSCRERPDSDREIQTIGIKVVEELRGVDGVQSQVEARRRLTQVGKEGGYHQDLHAVRQPDPEGSFGRAGVERLVTGHQRLNLGQRDSHGVGEREGTWCRAHAVRPAGQQLVAEQRAQAGEVVAHRRLPEADAGGGARDTALAEQGVKGDEQVKV